MNGPSREATKALVRDTFLARVRRARDGLNLADARDATDAMVELSGAVAGVERAILAHQTATADREDVTFDDLKAAIVTVGIRACEMFELSAVAPMKIEPTPKPLTLFVRARIAVARFLEWVGES